MAAACKLKKKKIPLKLHKAGKKTSIGDKRPRREKQEEKAANGETNKAGRKMQWLCRGIIKTGINPLSIKTKGLLSKCLTVAPS